MRSSILRSPPLGVIENERPLLAPPSLVRSELDRDFSTTLTAIGGLKARARIHSIHPAKPGDECAASGFAFTLFAHLASLAGGLQRSPRHPRPILWIQDRRARLEAGVPYAHGFRCFGLDPAQLIIISTRTALDALAATEIGLETGGLDGVLAELPSNLPADMLALGKRLALRAERSFTPCLLLHASAAPVPTPVATRWQVSSNPSVPGQHWAQPLPAVELTLVKNRFGPTGVWSAILSPPAHLSEVSNVRVTDLPPSLSQPLDAVSSDRSGQEKQSAVA